MRLLNRVLIFVVSGAVLAGTVFGTIEITKLNEHEQAVVDRHHEVVAFANELQGKYTNQSVLGNRLAIYQVCGSLKLRDFEDRYRYEKVIEVYTLAVGMVGLEGYTEYASSMTTLMDAYNLGGERLMEEYCLEQFNKDAIDYDLTL